MRLVVAIAAFAVLMELSHEADGLVLRLLFGAASGLALYFVMIESRLRRAKRKMRT